MPSVLGKQTDLLVLSCLDVLAFFCSQCLFSGPLPGILYAPSAFAGAMLSLECESPPFLRCAMLSYAWCWSSSLSLSLSLLPVPLAAGINV